MCTDVNVILNHLSLYCVYVCVCMISVHYANLSVSAIVCRAVPNILFVFYSDPIVGQIMYSYSAE